MTHIHLSINWRKQTAFAMLAHVRSATGPVMFLKVYAASIFNYISNSKCVFTLVRLNTRADMFGCSFVYPFSGVAVAGVAEVIERVSKAKNPREQRHHIKTLQSSVLPKLAQKRSLQGIAKCMVVDDIEVQRTAATLLRTKLMQLTYR